MNSIEIKRYSLFIASLAVFAVGASLCMRANLGVIPPLCPPYVLSCIPGQELSVGMLTIIMHLVFLLIQAILLRSEFSVRDLVQIPASIVAGVFLDLAMMATQSMQWGDSIGGYVIRILQLILGIGIVMTSYALQRYCREKMAGTGLIQAFAKSLKTTNIMVTIVFDISLAVTGLIFCIFYFGTVRWDLIGFGTLLSLVVHAMHNHWMLRGSQYYWDKESSSSSDIMAMDGDSADSSTFPLVVTIARMHGSGGRDIGYMVAQRLGVNFYDKEIICETAKELGIDKEKVMQSDQDISLRSIGRDEAVFAAQSHIIREAAKEPCVIIGRCADYVLRGRPYCLNIFIRSDEDYAVTLIRNKDNLSETQAREVIRLKNNAREKHYAHYTGGKWQDPSHYDLVINTAKIGVESAVDIICNAVNNITGG